MIIFIKNIPQNTLLSELKDFVQPALTGFIPFFSGKIEKVEILVLREKNTGLMEYHGLVEVGPEKNCQSVIKRLQGKSFKNRKVQIREYAIRTWQNDRRANHAHKFDHQCEGGRKGDRRRDMEHVRDVSHLFSAPTEARKLSFVY